MCLPAAVIGAVTALAGSMLTRGPAVQAATEPIPTKRATPPTPLTSAAQKGLQDDLLKDEEQKTTIQKTKQQKEARKRSLLGTKTLAAVPPSSSNLPTAPPQGISGVGGPTP